MNSWSTARHCDHLSSHSSLFIVYFTPNSLLLALINFSLFSTIHLFFPFFLYSLFLFPHSTLYTLFYSLFNPKSYTYIGEALKIWQQFQCMSLQRGQKVWNLALVLPKNYNWCRIRRIVKLVVWSWVKLERGGGWNVLYGGVDGLVGRKQNQQE